MTAQFVFPPYDNDQNYPTWALRQHVQSGPENIRLLAKFLAREGKLQEHFTLKMQGFLSITYQDKFREYLMRDWISCAVQWVDWIRVLSMLRGRHTALVLDQNPTNLDMAAVAYFETIPGIWQTIVSDAKGGEDEALKNWVLESVIIWITSREVRDYTTSPVSIFVKTCFDLVIASVDWSRLTESFQDY